LTAFWIACFFVFVAEMGDKTQLMTLTFSSRYRAGTVLAAVFGATLAIHLISVLVGEVLGIALPLFWINLIAGLVFIGFGLWTLRHRVGEDDKQAEKQTGWGPILTIAGAFFLAELGDRTMLATIVIASRQQNFFGVWFGSTTGMMLANGLAIIVGKVLGRNLPEAVIKYATVIIFVASGIFAIYAAFKSG
jgi:Ca2+/H+ antiporter, TMEM165/GDT1 family